MRILLTFLRLLIYYNVLAQTEYKTPEAFFNKEVYPLINSSYNDAIINNVKEGFKNALQNVCEECKSGDKEMLAFFIKNMSLNEHLVFELDKNVYFFYFNYGFGTLSSNRAMYLLITLKANKEFKLTGLKILNKYGIDRTLYLKPEKINGSKLFLSGSGYKEEDSQCCPTYNMKVSSEVDWISGSIRIDSLSLSPHPNRNKDKDVEITSTQRDYSNQPSNFGVRVMNIPPQSFEDEFDNNATVAMEVVADSNGKVTSANYTSRGSTGTATAKMIEIAKRLAFQLKIGPADGIQKGIIKFNFKSK